jgi:hypothetical protein
VARSPLTVKNLGRGAGEKKRGGISPSPMEDILLRDLCEWGTAKHSSRQTSRRYYCSPGSCSSRLCCD